MSLKYFYFLIFTNLVLNSCNFSNENDCKDDEMINYLSKDSSFNYFEFISVGFPQQIKINGNEIGIMNNENDKVVYYIFDILEKKLQLKFESPIGDYTFNRFSFDENYLNIIGNIHANEIYRYNRKTLKTDILNIPIFNGFLFGDFDIINNILIFNGSLSGIAFYNTQDSTHLLIGHGDKVVGSSLENEFVSDLSAPQFVYVTKQSDTNKEAIDLFKIDLKNLSVVWRKELIVHLNGNSPQNKLIIKLDVEDSVVIVAYDAYIYAVNTENATLVGKQYLEGEMGDLHIDTKENSIKLFVYPPYDGEYKLNVQNFEYSSNSFKLNSSEIGESICWSIFNFGEITIINQKPPNLDAYCMDGSKIAKIIHINCEHAEMVKYYTNPFTGQSLMEFKKVIYYGNN